MREIDLVSKYVCMSLCKKDTSHVIFKKIDKIIWHKITKLFLIITAKTLEKKILNLSSLICFLLWAKKMFFFLKLNQYHYDRDITFHHYDWDIIFRLLNFQFNSYILLKLHLRRLMFSLHQPTPLLISWNWVEKGMNAWRLFKCQNQLLRRDSMKTRWAIARKFAN